MEEDTQTDNTHAFVRGSDPRVATCRGKLQSRRSKLNQEINRELRLRAGAENLFRATTNRKMKETVALELSFVNSNLQLLKEQLAELNSSVEIYQGDSKEPSMPMIPLGLKETKEIDFREPFKDFILEHYSEDSAKYEEAIGEFMELRQAMRTPQRDALGVSLLFRYYNQLYFVERRFFPPERSLGIYFEWYDSLTGVPSCQRTVAFEKACVLFNLAAVYTQMGARQERGRAKSLDQAVEGFLRAAGLLAYLLDNFTNAPTMDLSPPVLDTLTHTMLAQARECLFEKLELQSEDKKSADMYFDLAQEAAKIAEVYRDGERVMGEVCDYLPAGWQSLAQVKRQYYQGLSGVRTAKGLLLLSKTPNKTAVKAQGLVVACGDTAFIEATTPSQQFRLLASAHLKAALGHHEEAARMQRMCRELKSKRCLSQVLAKAGKEAQELYSAVQESSQDLAELLDPPALPAKSQLVLSLAMPDFGQEKVEDLFKSLGPLAVFSAKLHWSAPRTVNLQNTRPGARDAAGYGFTISTDCPVVVASVQPNSLAEAGGIKEGDFIVGIGEEDVKWSSHDEVVRLIRESNPGRGLSIRLVTPVTKNYLKPGRTKTKLPKKASGDGGEGQKGEGRTPQAGAKDSCSCGSPKDSCGSPKASSPGAGLSSYRKLSWNPFRRSRERENAINAILR